MKNIDISFTATNDSSDVLVLPVSNGTIESGLTSLNEAITFNMAAAPNFKGKLGQTLDFAAPEGNSYKRIMLLELGKGKTGTKELREAGKSLFESLKKTGYQNADISMASVFDLKETNGLSAAILADAVNAASYKFDKYFTDERAKEKGLGTLNFTAHNPKEAESEFAKLNEITQGEFLAADMMNEPGNIMYPKTAAKLIQKELGDIPGVTVKVLTTKDMKKEKMGAALAVAKGSSKAPRIVIVEYDGTNGQTKDWPLAFVGKGVTFDAGGISLKPGAGMEDMKFDMGGASAVAGAMRALAGRGAKTKIVAVMAFAENMPDGKAIKPGDVITSRSGKTFTIGNTDAEGRMVLCDAIDYVQDKYTNKDTTMVDLATLTGAMLMTGAHYLSGIFTNNKKLAKVLVKAGDKSGQPAFTMPMHKVFEKHMKGKIADLHNMSDMRFGGSTTAAKFLENFVKTKKWAHLDIAGTGIPANGISTGFGVRWLDTFVADNFEEKAELTAKPEQKVEVAHHHA